MIARVLENTGATLQDWGMMYKAVTQLVLLYGSESWVMTGEMLNALKGLCHWAERRITGMTAKHGVGGVYEYPLVVAAMESAGLHHII